MSLRTATANGNWNLASTWGGSAPPIAGDTALVPSPYTVTVTAAASVGTSPADATTAALTVANGATLLVNAPLTVKGNLFANGTLAVGPGAGIEFDSSGDGVTSGPHTSYALQTTYGSVLHVNGTTGSRAYLRSNAAGGNAQATSGGNLFDLVLSNCDFTRLGTTSAAGLALQAATGDAGPGETVIVTGCHFDHCGGLTFPGVRADVRFEVTNNRWTNSYANVSLGGFGVPIGFVASDTAVNTGTRLFTGNSLDVAPWFGVPTGWTITGNYFGLGYFVTHAASGGWAAFANNLVRQPDGSNTYIALVMGDFNDNYVLADANGVDNWHSVGLQAADWTSDLSALRNVWDGPFVTNPSDGGEMLYAGDPAAPHAWTIANNLILPSTLNVAGGSSAASPGALVTVTWPPDLPHGIDGISHNASFIIEHNTLYADSVSQDGAFHFGETANTPRAGEVSSYRSNLVWSHPGNGGFHVADRGFTFAVNDVIAAGQANHNCGSNLGAGHGGNPAGYSYAATTTPGAADVNVNPTFVDSTRNIATWAVTRGSTSGTTAGQVADGLAFLAAAPGLTASSLMPYVRAGFAPTNAALNGTAHDATDIGAVPYQAPAPPTTTTARAAKWFPMRRSR